VGYSANGAEFTVDVASSGIDPGNQTFKHSPVLRFVAELTPEKIQSWWIVSSGNGGAGGSTMAILWMNGLKTNISKFRMTWNQEMPHL